MPAGHQVSPSGQTGASKCPFLAAEMAQKNSSVVRQVGLEFQEDVQEVRTVQKGKLSLHKQNHSNLVKLGFCLLFLQQCSLAFSEVSPEQLQKPSINTTPKQTGVEPNDLIKSLLKQRPKRVSHMLRDNLIGKGTVRFVSGNVFKQ